MTYKLILIASVMVITSFFVGFGTGSSGSTKTTSVTPPQDQTKVACSQIADWKKLKEVDDQVIDTSAKGFGIASDMVTHTAISDYNALSQDNVRLEDLNSSSSSLADQRKAVLLRLGY